MTIDLNGYTVTGYVYIASSTALADFTQLVVDVWSTSGGASGAENYTAILSTPSSPFPINSWIPLQISTGLGSTVADHVAIALLPNATEWSGTMYLDDIAVTGL
jgi:hypothetical protein